MADNVWRESHWYFDFVRDAWRLTEAGAYPSDQEPPHRITIQGRDIRSLIPKLDEDGWLKPRLDERLRGEDLKITHRLLDIIERQVK